MLVSQITSHFAQYTAAVQNLFLPESASPQLAIPKLPDFWFSDQWQVLGPFQIGTREAPWSSDSLEYEGGFHNLEYSPSATYRSSLAFNGSVFWMNETASVSEPNADFSKAYLHVDFFPSIDWPFLQDVYGWAGHQWAGWARGQIYVQSQETKTLNLWLTNVLEYWVDDTRHFGGDFYGERRAALTLHLDPGVHTIEVKLVGDVRSAGGLGSPTVDVALELHESAPELKLVWRGDESVMIADVVGGDFGTLASPYAFITVRNDAEENIVVQGFEGMKDVCEVEMLPGSPIKLLPGQSRPISFMIGCVPSWNRRIRLHLKYNIEGESGIRSILISVWPNIIRDIDATHKFTYLHPSGIVSWGILRPPSLYAQCGDGPNASVPIMPALHGAGVRADDYPLMHMFDPLPDLCAWLVFPQGATSWSGDDWHNWGFADLEAAIAAVPQWIEQVEWKGPGADIDRWLMTGHSNGGQGVWYAITHRPDKMIAAAALSGYSSIQNYVPYSSWRTVEPARMGIMQAALSTYRHDLLVDNTKGIPLVIQHGSKDDNVPAYHSRLMNQRIYEGGEECAYFEIPDEPHFWDGVATTKPLRHFFTKHLQVAKPEEVQTPVHLESFAIVVADPGSMGPKHGVHVLQLNRPGQLGRLEFTFDPLTWACIFHASNVDEFTLPHPFDICDSLVVNGQNIDAHSPAAPDRRLLKLRNGWTFVDDRLSVDSLPKRTGRQLGQLDSIVRTRGAFQIVRHSKETEHIASQISRNLVQYFAADTEITNDYEAALAADGNVISISIANDLPDRANTDFPIWLVDGVTVRDGDVNWRYTARSEGKLAAIFLRPLPDERLELVVWGIDAPSVELAARLVPMMTGSGQPDWIVLDDTLLWKGLDGSLALGFFNYDWEISRNSYFS